MNKCLQIDKKHLQFIKKGGTITILMEVTLTTDQENAKKLIEEWFLHTKDNVFVLAGYAGTGKTFLIDYVVKETLGLRVGKDAVFVSPTGKAAVNLVKKGTEAGTIHGLIYYREGEEYDVNEDGEIIQLQDLHFYKRDKIEENIRLIIIDEASMVNETMLNDLLSFDVKCLFCGDSAQLPPVNGTCPLLDNPHYTMTEIVRQAKDNPIIQLATMAREGKRIPYGNYGDKAYVVGKNALSRKQRQRLFLEADQIICGRNATRTALNNEIRVYKGIDKTQVLPLDGEKLICTLNDWEKPLDADGRFFLVNGVIGTASAVREELDGIATMDFQPDFLDEAIHVSFDTAIFTDGEYKTGYGDKAITLANGIVVHESNFAMLHKFRNVSETIIDRFEYAYAITCHKAQGSEFDFVIVFDESWVFGEEKDRWLYTAITRAKEKLLIIR